ncbi:MAG: hypothetical protein AABX66_02595 [Nanoarchaeota archaeon]
MGNITGTQWIVIVLLGVLLLIGAVSYSGIFEKKIMFSSGSGSGYNTTNSTNVTVSNNSCAGPNPCVSDCSCNCTNETSTILPGTLVSLGTTNGRCCGGSAIDPNTDNNNCGGCGIACSNGSYCFQGSCSVCPSCPTTQGCYSYLGAGSLTDANSLSSIIQNRCISLGGGISLLVYTVPPVQPYQGCGAVPGSSVFGIAISCSSNH